MSGYAVGAAVVTLIGAGVSAHASYQAAQSSAALARYNAAQQQAQNQAMLEQSAAKSLAERTENQKILANQEAMFAASGVATNTGSPLTVETKQAALLERRALNTDYAGAMAYRTGQSSVYGNWMQAAAAKKTAGLSATGTLLSGVGSAAGGYYNMGGPGT